MVPEFQVYWKTIEHIWLAEDLSLYLLCRWLSFIYFILILGFSPVFSHPWLICMPHFPVIIYRKFTGKLDYSALFGSENKFTRRLFWNGSCCQWYCSGSDPYTFAMGPHCSCNTYIEYWYIFREEQAVIIHTSWLATKELCYSLFEFNLISL